MWRDCAEYFVLIPIYPVVGRFTRPCGYLCVSFIFGGGGLVLRGSWGMKMREVARTLIT